MNVELQAVLRRPAVLAAGIALGLVASLCFNLGLALQKRAALGLPRVSAGTLSALGRFARSRAWLASVALIGAGWLLQFFALSFAPIGLVMPAVAAGIVFQALLANRWFGERLTPGELGGIALCTVGLLGMAASLNAHGELAGLDIAWTKLFFVAGVLVLLALAAVLGARLAGSRSGTAQAAAAGLLFATTGILTKALGIGALHEQSLGVSALTVLLMLATGAVALVLLQTAHQRGRAIVVVPLMGMLADFVPASLGPLLFAEPWPAGWPRAVRLAAFGAIASGTLLLARPAAASDAGERGEASERTEGPELAPERTRGE